MTRASVVVVLACSTLLAGCAGAASGPAAGAAQHDPPASVGSATVPAPVSLDGGALVIEPLASAPSGGSREQAARVLAAVSYDGLEGAGAGPWTPVAAHVKADVPATKDVAGRGLELLDLPQAWVYVVPAGDASGFPCAISPPAGQSSWAPSPSPLPAGASDSYAVIVDAVTARGYVYSGAGTGGACWRRSSPTVSSTALVLSLRYRVHRITSRSARVTVSLPPCATFGSFTPSFSAQDGRRGIARGLVPTGLCAGGAGTLVHDVPGRFTESPHWPVGVMCGAAYDAVLGRPADCVAGG